MENAVKHGMKGGEPLHISVVTRQTAEAIEIVVEDDGAGFTPEDGAAFGALDNIRQRLAMMCGGSLEISSKLGEGTKVVATLVPSSIDCLPLGDVGESLAALVGSCEKTCDFVVIFKHDVNGESVIDTREIKEKLDGMSLQEPEIYLFLCDYYREQQESILGGL